MSFVLNNRLLLNLRPGRPLFLFLLLWLLSGLFLFAHLQILKSQIQNQGVQRLQLGLDTYLQRSGNNSKGNLVLEREIPREMDFIRLVRDRDQLLFTGNTTMNFTGLVDLDPLAHGIWIDLLHPADSGNWLLVSRKLAGGGVVQAGKDDTSAGIGIYRRAVSVSLWIFLLAALPSLALSFFLRYLQTQPLQQLQDDIKRVLGQRELPLPQKGKQYEELTPLYLQLEQLFRQNRQLIQEMQSSLDNVAHDLRTPMTRLRAVETRRCGVSVAPGRGVCDAPRLRARQRTAPASRSGPLAA